MKKIIAFLLTAALVLSLAACGTDNDTSSSAANSKPESTASADGKTLVVYYSATGSTKKVAENIADAASADIFEITPQEKYTDDDLNWSDDDSRVSREHNDEKLRDVPLVTTEVANWASYDTVFIGYPIWWGDAAWVVNNFVKNNDFSGKTVIPFCTSASSGLGNSAKKLEELSGTGNWLEGKRFSSGESKETVTEWVKTLNLSK